MVKSYQAVDGTIVNSLFIFGRKTVECCYPVVAKRLVKKHGDCKLEWAAKRVHYAFFGDIVKRIGNHYSVVSLWA